MEFEQRIVVAAETVGERSCARYRFVKEGADGRTVDGAGMNFDFNDPTREVIHDNQGPTRLNDNRLAAKEANTPQTVLRVRKKGQPG